MDRDEAQEWIRFIDAVEQRHKADYDERDALLRRFPSHFVMMTFWLNCLKVTGGEPIEAAGPPDECDHCGTDLKTSGLFIDGMTKGGPWSFMCTPCFAQHGAGIGWGLGQLFRLSGETEDGDPRWICIAGGPPDQGSAEGTTC